MPVAYRISKATYAATLWSGAGAREFGGRWNSKGVAVVYAAENRALAALEQLVHLVKPRVLTGFVVSSIVFDEAMVLRLDSATLPSGWNRPVPPRALAEVGDQWARDGKFAVLAVPSAIIDGELNYLFNPAHRDFASMKRSKPKPFIFDRRLNG